MFKLMLSELWAKVKGYFWNILIGLDQLFNVCLAGYPDETFSARTYRKAKAGQWFWRALAWLIDKAFFWDAEHCRSSYQRELERGHCPKEFSNG
jgi:hypothetical protein